MSSDVFKDYVHRPSVDVKTLGVISLMAFGFPLLGWAHARGFIPWWIAGILGTWLMNLSFTAWHESSHGNFSKYHWLNDVSGMIASFVSVYPGYFARRREHLIHHRYEGQQGKDPVYDRIQTSFWKFPWTLVRVNSKAIPLDVPEHFVPMKPWHRLMDMLSNIFALGFTLMLMGMGYGWSVFWVWIIPRGLVFLIHAYVICYFPHHIDSGGYQLYRVREGNWWIRLVAVGQNYHGIHHKWPMIPWHQYASVFKRFRSQFAQEKIEILANEC